MKKLLKIINFVEFKKYLNQHGYNKVTIQSYEAGLQHLDQYLTQNNINIESLTTQKINEFIRHNTTISNSTKNVYIAGIKKYIIFMQKTAEINININEIQLLKIEKINKLEINWNSDILPVLNQLQKNKTPSGQRDLLMIDLLLKTGINISELIQLKIKNIFKNKIISYNKIEYIINNDLYNLLNLYINKLNNKSEYLFTPLSKNTNNKKPLTIRSIQRLIRTNFNNIKYHDLKLLYYKSLIQRLPEINKLHKHSAMKMIINTNNIEKIL